MKVFSPEASHYRAKKITSLFNVKMARQVFKENLKKKKDGNMITPKKQSKFLVTNTKEIEIYELSDKELIIII